MPRFVVLIHQTPPEYPRGDHWDFMLEAEGSLRTWALEVAPEPGIEIAAQELADHRLDYLEYEGPISGDRGSVSRWDAGAYEMIADDSAPTQACHWRVRLHGQRLQGVALFTRLDGHRWTFSFAADHSASG